MTPKNSAATALLLVLLSIQLLVYAIGGGGSRAYPEGREGTAPVGREGTYEASRTASPVARIPPDSLSSSFRAYRQEEPAKAGIGFSAPEPERELTRYVMLGAVTDGNGVKRIFLKNAETGRIYGAWLDGTPEKGVRYFVRDNREIIVIDGVEGVVEKD